MERGHQTSPGRRGTAIGKGRAHGAGSGDRAWPCVALGMTEPSQGRAQSQVRKAARPRASCVILGKPLNADAPPLLPLWTGETSCARLLCRGELNTWRRLGCSKDPLLLELSFPPGGLSVHSGKMGLSEETPLGDPETVRLYSSGILGKSSR